MAPWASTKLCNKLHAVSSIKNHAMAMLNIAKGTLFKHSTLLNLHLPIHYKIITDFMWEKKKDHFTVH